MELDGCTLFPVLTLFYSIRSTSQQLAGRQLLKASCSCTTGESTTRSLLLSSAPSVRWDTTVAILLRKDIIPSPNQIECPLAAILSERTCTNHVILDRKLTLQRRMRRNSFQVSGAYFPQDKVARAVQSMFCKQYFK